MRILIARHGATKEGKKGIILGSLPGTLSTQGKKEAKEIAKELKTKKFIPDIIISSNQKRALDTASIIKKEIDKNILIKIDKLIAERKAGIAEGKKEEEIDWSSYEKKPLLLRKHKGGESFQEVIKRAKKFSANLKKYEKYKTILIVSHSVFIAAFLSILYNQPIEKFLSSKSKNKITVFDLK
ncbi:MAG: hypothetical protein A2604_02825 [Candidatus Liptonbacteria bacterium RIFOXYD1_FULL_36_11]|uniref:Phosphoglycerate mutase n=1 Tax=Candidatus Liptonbacteria bacterium RIFOXYD1_FULL_36_11 TaxID=1798656 RepID=A0A1G2CRF7_9BACT|nr:MAG: hypothetical protein A2604_02825 [Candidatus Liptonbacteria bacterium RIFOXYD1_FULL_36_11]